MPRLVRTNSAEASALPSGMPVVIGRSPDVEIPVADATMSRRHAELVVVGSELKVRDLGSSNGTFINDQRVDTGIASPGDTVMFGKVAFRFEAETAPEPQILKQRTVGTPTPALSTTPEATSVWARPTPPAGHELTKRKLALLLEVSAALGRVESIDALLRQIAGYVFQIMDVDRVAILLMDGDTLVPAVGRDRNGDPIGEPVPRSIARRVVSERVAVLSGNAPEDQRFAGASIVMQSVRSAMCAPLIGMEGEVEGVIYVDNLTATQRFGDDDLEFLIAFSGIAAVAIENGRFAERVRREALTRGNFERFFTPALAARIASSGQALQLGGEKRRVAVLFSDIRGFTSMSEHMPPEDVATLLSEYFTAMVECVFRHGGTLDKFIGDAIMAQWGAPVSGERDADAALTAALEMQDELTRLNATWSRAGRPSLRIGIGLNVGDVFAGYIGSERRLEYTVLGDAVNLASRLCSAAGAGEILISGDMLSELEMRPAVTPVKGLTLKGMTREISIYAAAR